MFAVGKRGDGAAAEPGAGAALDPEPDPVAASAPGPLHLKNSPTPEAVPYTLNLKHKTVPCT